MQRPIINTIDYREDLDYTDSRDTPHSDKGRRGLQVKWRKLGLKRCRPPHCTTNVFFMTELAGGWRFVGREGEVG